MRILLLSSIILLIGIGQAGSVRGAGPVSPKVIPYCDNPRLSSVETIRCVFPPKHRKRAIRIMMCESGGSVTARNGEYYGLFQLGKRERETYAGRGYRTGFQQVHAAYNLWSYRGWQPWSCK